MIRVLRHTQNSMLGHRIFSFFFLLFWSFTIEKSEKCPPPHVSDIQKSTLFFSLLSHFTSFRPIFPSLFFFSALFSYFPAAGAIKPQSLLVLWQPFLVLRFNKSFLLLCTVLFCVSFGEKEKKKMRRNFFLLRFICLASFFYKLYSLVYLSFFTLFHSTPSKGCRWKIKRTDHDSAGGEERNHWTP